MNFFNNAEIPVILIQVNIIRAGHNNPHPVLAFGTKIIINGDKKKVVFTESGNKE